MTTSTAPSQNTTMPPSTTQPASIPASTLEAKPAPARRPVTIPAQRPAPVLRSGGQKLLDFLTFPLRAFTLFHHDGFGLSCLATERFDYVAREVRGFTLDIGCGRDNHFVRHQLRGHGLGIDLFAYEGLTAENLVESLTTFPYEDNTFDSITFIANINHCPRQDRDKELAEALRVLRPGGRIIITMASPVAELLVHKVVWLWDKLFKTNVDMDSERGMEEGEEYYLTDEEIRSRLKKAGFGPCRKKRFTTQWWLNAMYIAEKPGAAR